MEALMRVFLCTAPSANNASIPNSRVWINNLWRGLDSLGVQIILPTFDTYRHMEECQGHVQGVDPLEARARYSELLVQDVRRAYSHEGLDLFIAYVWDIHVLPDAIHQIRSLGVPTVLFYCNAAHQFHLVAKIAPSFDYCMVPEREALMKYRAVGANPIHIQMAADPEMYRPFDVPRLYEATFVGQMYFNRSDYVGYLIWHGVDVRVWGPGWLQAHEWIRRAGPARRARHFLGNLQKTIQRQFGMTPTWYPVPKRNCGGILSDEEIVRIPSQCHIALNFSEVQDEVTGEIKRHIRLRDFEVPMSGGLLLTGYQDELAEYYDIGREILCYDSKEELLDKCRYYLSHPQEAEAIRWAGYRRARREHTWANRFQQLFDQIGIRVRTGRQAPTWPSLGISY